MILIENRLKLNYKLIDHMKNRIKVISRLIIPLIVLGCSKGQTTFYKKTLGFVTKFETYSYPMIKLKK